MLNFTTKIKIDLIIFIVIIIIMDYKKLNDEELIELCKEKNIDYF